MRFWLLPLTSCALSLLACTNTPKPIEHPVAPRSPATNRDKRAASERPAADAHAAALEQLAVAEVGTRKDRQQSIRVPLPDSKSWRRVRFMGVKSLVGFRYGTEHHAVVGALSMELKGRTAESCQKHFEDWAKPWLETFEVSYEYDQPIGFSWRHSLHPEQPATIMSAMTVRGKVSSMLLNESYHAAYAIFPAWPDRCLVIGFAVADTGETERAKKARDRFAREVLPQLEILSAEAPSKTF